MDHGGSETCVVDGSGGRESVSRRDPDTTRSLARLWAQSDVCGARVGGAAVRLTARPWHHRSLARLWAQPGLCLRGGALALVLARARKKPTRRTQKNMRRAAPRCTLAAGVRPLAARGAACTARRVTRHAPPCQHAARRLCLTPALAARRVAPRPRASTSSHAPRRRISRPSAYAVPAQSACDRNPQSRFDSS